MTRQLHRRLNAAQRDTIRLAKSATVKYALPRPPGKPNPPSHKEIEPMPIDSPYVPIAMIALELGQPVEQLAARLDGAVVLDGIGMRCVSRETAAGAIAEHKAQQDARQAEQARRRAEFKARYSELDARNRAQRTGGVPVPAGTPPGVLALSVMPRD